MLCLISRAIDVSLFQPSQRRTVPARLWGEDVRVWINPDVPNCLEIIRAYQFTHPYLKAHVIVRGSPAWEVPVSELEFVIALENEATEAAMAEAA